MSDFLKKYYEQSVFWDDNYLENPAEKERVEQIVEIIPSDVNEIFDVGCGNGCFINTLVSSFSNRFNRVIGLDSSDMALKYVKSEKIKGSITNLPFEDESFDLVTSLEVLEHLPQEDFKQGISELHRVSKKYIIITVPNNENLETSLVMCPLCYCRFNAHYHVRSFNEDDLNKLFTGFRAVRITEIGPIIKNRSYNHKLLAIYHIWRKPFPPESSICPQCGYKHTGFIKSSKNTKVSNRFLSSILPLFIPVANLFSPIKMKKRWLLALYEKTVI